MPSEPQKSLVHAPPAQTTAEVGHDPMLGDRGGDAAAGALDATHRAGADDACAGALRAAGEGGARTARFGAPVASRVHRSCPSNTIGAQDLVQRGGAQHAGVEAVRSCNRQPLRKLVERRTRLGEVERTSLPKSEILPQLGRKALPERQAPDHERKLDRGATLLAHPAPVAPRLFAGDAAFLEQGDRQALACKKIGGRDADDAAADNHDVGRSRQRTYRGVPGPFVSAGSRRPAVHRSRRWSAAPLAPAISASAAMLRRGRAIRS